MRSINLTPEKNATRSVGVYVADNYEKLGVKDSEYISSYNNLTKDQWLDFDRLVEESTVFMFVRNPFDRFVSSFIHNCLGGDYRGDFPEWYFDLPVKKDNQLKCFKSFSLAFAKKFNTFEHITNQHIDLQTRVIDQRVRATDEINVEGVLDNFSIIPYIEDEKIVVGRVEDIKKDIPKISSLIFDSNPPVKFDTWIGDNTHVKFSVDCRDWYDNELQDVMTPLFQKELEIFDYPLVFDK